MPEGRSTADDPRRRLLLELLHAALARVDGRRCTREALLAEPGEAPIDRHFHVAAIGKAASAMALGAHDALGERIRHLLLITKDGHVDAGARSLPRTEILESAHPVPDSRSLEAGNRLLRWVQELPSGIEPLFLVSGGASSLVEVLEPGTGLGDLKALNERGLASGWSIGELNAQRSRLSRIKGGRLAAHFATRPARALFISDVPGDDPAVIGSGLMGPGSAPDAVRRSVIASIDHAMAAARAAAQARGLEAWSDTKRFEDEAERLAVRFVHELHMNLAPVRIWGGESVVRLPPQPGRGGRNQQLALAAARVMAGHEDMLLLCAGTDGTDGPTEDAGALVDGETCSRIAIAELDVEAALRGADAGRALELSGDLVHTGPTGTNVGDLVIGLKLPL
jgi:glycerate 2-kinase